MYTSLVPIEFVRASTRNKQTSIQSIPTSKLMLTNTFSCESCSCLEKGAISKHNNNLYTCWPSKSCSCPSQGAYASAGALILSNRITSYEGDDNHPPEKWATMNWGTWDFWEWDFEVSVNELHRKNKKSTWNLAVQQRYHATGEFSFRRGLWKIDFHLRFGLWSCHLQGWRQSGNELQRRV